MTDIEPVLPMALNLIFIRAPAPISGTVELPEIFKTPGLDESTLTSQFALIVPSVTMSKYSILAGL